MYTSDGKLPQSPAIVRFTSYNQFQTFLGANQSGEHFQANGQVYFSSTKDQDRFNQEWALTATYTNGGARYTRVVQ